MVVIVKYLIPGGLVATGLRCVRLALPPLPPYLGPKVLISKGVGSGPVLCLVQTAGLNAKGSAAGLSLLFTY
jgi:hypothetical protein